MWPRSRQNQARIPAIRSPSAGVAGLEAPGQGGAQVVVLRLEPVQPRRRPRAAEVRIGLLGERQEVLGVPAAEGCQPRRSPRAAPGRTRGSSPASRAAGSRRRPRLGAAGSCPPAPPPRPARRSPVHALADRPPRPPPACSRRRTRPAAGRAAAPPAQQVVAPGDRARAASAGGPAGRARRRSAAAAGARAGPAAPPACSSRTRAAASSMASGSPSSRRQIAATAGAFSSVRAKSGLRGLRPLDEEADRLVLASAASSGRQRSRAGQRQRRHRESCSPYRCSSARLVASDLQLRARPRAAPPTSGAAASTCSKLSSTQQQLLRSADGGAERLGQRPATAVLRRPSAWAMAEATSPGSLIGASATKNTPSAKCSITSAATCSARRVLPIPPGPVRVSSRTSVAQQPPPHLRQLAAASDQRGRLHRQVVRVALQRAERRELRREAVDDELERCARAAGGPSGGAHPGHAGSRPTGSACSTSTRVASERRTWPPWPAAHRRAARWTSSPT